MSKNADSLPGRTERLIPLVRETFGSAVLVKSSFTMVTETAPGVPTL